MDRYRHELVVRSALPVPAAEAFAWHARPGAFERLSPPWQDVRVVERSGDGIEDGARLVMELRAGPLRRRWVAVHSGYEPGRRFVDTQESGPFAAWRHTHTVEPDPADPAGASVLEDHVEYTLPGGPAANALGAPLARAQLERLFAFRHARTAADLERHAASAGRPRLRVGITGASGLVGAQLAAFLTTGGHEAVALRRTGDPASPGWDAAALEGLDAVVHLAGEPIAQRWTPAAKERILASRRDGTRRLAESLAALAQPPRALVAASAIGIYGDRGDEELPEAAARGAGFLADVVAEWEAACAPAREKGIRVVNARLGVVLSPRGGALAKLLPPFLAGAGGPVGSGRQWVPWIGLDDVVGALHALLMDDGVDGPVNVVAPQPVRSTELARTLGRVLHRPSLVPVPAPAVGALFGEMGRATLLGSQRVVPARLAAAGFPFLAPDLETALRRELGR
mgnify:CR=1 FL=1